MLKISAAIFANFSALWLATFLEILLIHTVVRETSLCRNFALAPFILIYTKPVLIAYDIAHRCKHFVNCRRRKDLFFWARFKTPPPPKISLSIFEVHTEHVPILTDQERPSDAFNGSMPWNFGSTRSRATYKCRTIIYFKGLHAGGPSPTNFPILRILPFQVSKLEWNREPVLA